VGFRCHRVPPANEEEVFERATLGVRAVPARLGRVAHWLGPVDFRSLRDSYATWSALAGVGDPVLQRRMGHASASTTDRYVKAAEAFDAAAIGAPFPALPKAILEAVWTNDWTRNAKTPGKRRGFLVARVGFEPTTFGL
jgi:hypothetical protein